MKKIHLIAALMIGVAVVILITASDEMGTYSTFQIADQSPDKVKIVGELAKDREMTYNPQKDPNYFSFYMKDSNGEERKVVLLSAKPQDFERSEQIVVTGKMVEGEFLATDMLLKCPSKYKDEEIYIRSESKTG